MNPKTGLQRCQRLVLSKMSYRPRRIALLTCVLVLISISVFYNIRSLVPIDSVNFMYSEIGSIFRMNPASIHENYLQTWRERMIRPDGLPYNLSEPSRADFSRGQSRVVLALSGNKVGSCKSFLEIFFLCNLYIYIYYSVNIQLSSALLATILATHSTFPYCFSFQPKH